jgi:hypothetical protein
VKLPLEPPWMADLPRLEVRPQYPCPATVDWVDGHPDGTGSGYVRSLVLASRRRCSFCGYPLRRGQPVYAVVWGGSASEFGPANNYTVWPGPLFGVHRLGPVHRSCAIYPASGGCPFLKYPQSAGRTWPNIGLRRGDAVLMGFRRYGLVFVNPATNVDSHVWGFAGPVETVPFPTFKTIEPLYEESIARDAKLVDMTQERYFWTDSADDIARLSSMWASDSVKFTQWQMSSWETVGGYTYRMHFL